MTKLNARSFIQWSGALALAGLAANATAATFDLQHGVFPDASYQYQHALIRNDTFLSDTPQFDSTLLVGTKADTGLGDQGELRSIVQFNLTPIAASIGDAPIESVSLWLRHSFSMGLPRIDGTPIVDVYSYGFNVDQDTSTWNDPDGDGNPLTGDTTPGGTLGTFINTLGELSQADGIVERTLTSTPEFVSAVETALSGDGFLRLILVERDPDLADRDIAFFSGNTTQNNTFLPRLTIETEGSAGVFGDYNGDNIVNAADYAVWRDNLNAVQALSNEDPAVTPGEVTQEDYDVWLANFGQTTAGSALGTATVPEPHTLAFGLSAMAWLLLFGRPVGSGFGRSRDNA